MTLPELCDRSDKRESTMPNTLTVNPLKNTPTIDDDTILTITNNNSDDEGETKDIKGSIDDNEHQQNTVGEALKELLQQAATEGRVTCSLGSSVDLLSSHPDDVMLCVMPLLPHPDAAATIQSTLIRAVCLEHNIRVLSVDCDIKLAKTVIRSASTDEQEEEMRAAVARKITLMMMEDEEEEEEEWQEEEWDYNCNKVLIKTPARCTEDVGASSSSPASPALVSSPTCNNLAHVMGFPCVLVRYPPVPSREDELVAEFCKEQLYGYTMHDPYIELPD